MLAQLVERLAWDQEVARSSRSVLELDWFEWLARADLRKLVAVCPHPSGLCRYWNEPGAEYRARKFWKGLYETATGGGTERRERHGGTMSSDNHLTSKEPVLVEAARVVHDDRAKTYDNTRDGESYPAMRETAKLWNNYLGASGKHITLSAADVARMMALHKRARYTVNPQHRDSRVDELGYLGIAHDLELEEG